MEITKGDKKTWDIYANGFTCLVNQIDSDGTKFSYVWSKTKSNGTVDATWNLAHQSSQKSITISNSDVSQRATFNCTAEPLS